MDAVRWVGSLIIHVGIEYFIPVRVVFADRPGHWTRPLLVIQRSLGLAVFGGLEAVLGGVGLSLGYTVHTT